MKVLDFGLAKALEPVGCAPNVSQSPTNTSPAQMTGVGVILGTAAYMSPEQARGLPVDKRADIWAFGCVLYEMLTGRTVFPGSTVSDVIVSVLSLTPEWTALPVATPPVVTRLLRRCLEKDAKRRLRDIGDARLEVEEALTAPSDAMAPGTSPAQPVREFEFQRLTDFAGLKESPAVSPDGRMVAFVALVGGKRQIWIRLLAGGALLQLTRDEVDHEHPRWAPDSNSLIYYTPAARRDEPGTIWEISALGGWPRRVTSAIGGGDISHDGRRIALFQSSDGQLALMVVTRDGSRAERVTLVAAGSGYASPRWSPDDRLIAFQRSSGFAFDLVLEIASVTGDERSEIVHSEWLNGFSWLPDGSGFVYSSSRGSTLLYPPVFNLRTIGRDGGTDRPLTFGDQSYVDPDTHPTGKLLASRIRSQSDIWKFPVGRSPADNTRAAIRVTRQMGSVQTPSVSPDGTEVAYLSDNGGHGNIWVTRTDGTSARQITFEQNPAVAMGVLKWSPAENVIVFLMTRAGQSGLWTIRPDGSGLRQVIASGWGPCWSGDGRWLYYASMSDGHLRLEKVLIDGGQPVVVREEAAWLPAISTDGSTLYYIVPVRSDIFGIWGADAEIRCARPEDGASETIARIPGQRLPGLQKVLPITLSPDGQWLATPLTDGATTNLWVLPTAGGVMKPLTDFGDRSVVIERSISWSADNQYLYAAVAETETDVVLLDGLIR